MPDPGRFDWPGLVRLGLNGLKLAPREFWALTPVELMAMLGQDKARAPMGRARLLELARAFPDRRGTAMNGENDGGTGID